MYIKSLYAILALVLLSFPVTKVFADTDIDILAKKVSAIEKYIERITSKNASVVSDNAMRTSIANAVLWLQQSQEKSGHFAYEYLPYDDEYLSGDNIVRQAGALFALSEVARRSKEQNAQTQQTIEKAITFFENLSPKHTYEGAKVRCVTRNEESKVCMLGATALALTGVLGYVEAVPEKTDEYEDLIDEYVTFIMASKKPTTGFRDEYRIGIGFKGEKESSFSNGEALLSLVRYYQYNPDRKVKEVIDESFAYLENTEFDTPLYLWVMAALKDMQKLWPNNAYVTYGKEFTQWRIRNLTSSHNTIRNYCASTEGLVSAYSLLEGGSTTLEQERLRQEIDFWNRKNLTLQIDPQDTFKLVNENGQLIFKEVQDMEQAQGGFLTADNELTQRIDFTQHCISTYLQTLVDIDRKSL